MLTRVLPEAYRGELVTHAFWVADVKASDTPKALSIANKLDEKPSIILKRVKKSDEPGISSVLLCREGKATKEEIEQCFEKEKVADVSNVRLLTLIDQIPVMEVICYDQAERAFLESAWPITIKTRLDLKIKELTNHIISKELDEIAANIEKVTFIADQAMKAGHRRNACIVWNPKKKAIMAQASDLTALDDRSLDHAVMYCLRKCSEGQNEEMPFLGKHEAMDDDEDYLCKGYHIYMLEEPCRLLS